MFCPHFGGWFVWDFRQFFTGLVAAPAKACAAPAWAKDDRELWVNFGVNIWRCNVHRWLRKATETQSSLQDRVFLQAWVHLHLPHENAITKRKKMKGPDFRDSILVFRGVTSKKAACSCKNTDKHALLQSSHPKKVEKCIIVELLGNRVQSTRFWTPFHQHITTSSTKNCPKFTSWATLLRCKGPVALTSRALGKWVMDGHGQMRMRRLLVIFLTVDDVRWYS